MLCACGRRETDTPPAPSTDATTAVVAARPTVDQGLSLQGLQAAQFEPTCSLEAVVQLGSDKPFPVVNAVYLVPGDATVKLIGFATYKAKSEPLGSFAVLMASASAVYQVPGQTRFDRPDVAKFFNAPGMLTSGFQLDVSLKGLPAADYAVFLRGSAGTVCPSHQTVRIMPIVPTTG